MSEQGIFFTRERANEGCKLPLRTPDGKPTDHWLLVRHQVSDEFRAAKDIAMQDAAAKLAMVPTDDKKQRRALGEQAVMDARVALIAGWSFEEPFTPENVAAFLRQAPQIADQVDRFAANDKGFFGASPSSTTGRPLK